MTSSPLTLECFESDGALAPPPSPDFKRGLEAGLEQAADMSEAKRQQALTEISARLSDMQFGYAEARLHLLEQLRALLAQVAEAVVPQILQETFGEHLIHTLHDQFDKATAQAVQIAVATDLVAELSEAHPAFTFVADADLDVGQARLTHPETPLMIDTPALLADLQSALRGLDGTQRTQTHA